MRFCGNWRWLVLTIFRGTRAWWSTMKCLSSSNSCTESSILRINFYPLDWCYQDESSYYSVDRGLSNVWCSSPWLSPARACKEPLPCTIHCTLNVWSLGKRFCFPETKLKTVQRNDIKFSLKIFLLLQTFSNRLLHQKKNTTKLFMNLNPEIQTRWHWMKETSWWWVCTMQCTLFFVTKEIEIVVRITANRLYLWVLHLTGNYFLNNSGHLHIGKIEMENLSDNPLCQTSIIF